MSALEFQERPASGDARGILFLHHGRGSWEGDLLPLAEVLDPEHALHVVAPRAPIELPTQPGYHWYLVPRVGYPDHDSFHAALSALTDFHDETYERLGLGPERAVLGGFSMGAVMSFSTGLAAGRAAPAAITAFSGFVPTVDGWEPSLTDRTDLPVLISHGAQDPVITVDFGREARDLLEAGGLAPQYREFEGGHWIDEGSLMPAADVIDAALE
jgi:phospholipase/carboxylesterase